MTPDVSPNFKPEKPKREETANQRRGRINRQKGKRKQAAARKQLEAVWGVTASWHGRKANEETWDHLTAVKVECKAGKQVGPIATRFLAAEKQANASRAIGDPRPFLMVAMPDDWGTEGLVVMRLSAFRELMA